MAKPRFYLAALLAWATSALACGYTDHGTGSRTLQVNGSLSYNPIGDNDRSLVSIEVTKEGVPVTNAIVQVTDADTGAQFTVPSAGTTYEGTWAGYHRRVAWRVIAGDDSVACRLEGPGRHTVSAPAHASTHRAGAPLDVVWRTSDGVRGEEVTLRLTPGAYTATLSNDEGSAHIGAPALETGPTTLSVTRRTRVEPAGALPPSALTYNYEVVNEFLVR